MIQLEDGGWTIKVVVGGVVFHSAPFPSRDMARELDEKVGALVGLLETYGARVRTLNEQISRLQALLRDRHPLPPIPDDGVTGKVPSTW